MLCTEIVSDIQNNFCTQHVHPMFGKKKSFCQRFTCIYTNEFGHHERLCENNKNIPKKKSSLEIIKDANFMNDQVTCS